MSTLPQLPSGEWAIQVPGREPVPIVVGKIFLLGVQGERRMMRVTMKRKEGAWYAVVTWQSSPHLERRVELRRLKAGFFDQRERYAKVLGRD